MKLTLSSIAFAAFIGAANAASPSIQIENTAYIGADLGVSCAKLGVKRVVEKKGQQVVFCFNVKNTGDTYLKNLIMTNDKLSFFDNSIGLLAPGDSKTITYQSEINGDVANTVTVTGTPALPDKTAIDGANQVEAKDISHVVDSEAAIARKLQFALDGMDMYAAENSELDDCIQTKWDAKDKPGSLTCSKKDVYLENLMQFDEPKACIAGETIEITLEADIVLELDTTNDLGWFVDTSGGDAMEGSSCIVNGLQEKNEYLLVDKEDRDVPVGKVAWGTSPIGGGALVPGSGLDRRRKLLGDDGFGTDDFTSTDDGGFGDDGDDFANGDDGAVLGDGDECGDVFKETEDPGVIHTPFLVKKTVKCTDEDGDTKLDLAVCFTWHHSDQYNDNLCGFNDNLPGGYYGGCYCSRYNVGNIYVVVPDNSTDVLCK